MKNTEDANAGSLHPIVTRPFVRVEHGDSRTVLQTLDAATQSIELAGDAQRRSMQRMVRSPLCDRIRAAWHSRIGYHELMSAVFPYKEYPLAWRYSHNGGPPVCAMPFGKALRKLGLMRYDNHISGTPNAAVSDRRDNSKR